MRRFTVVEVAFRADVWSTLVNGTTRGADQFFGFMEMIKQKLITAANMHNDKTGVNIRGIFHWIHTAGNKNYT